MATVASIIADIASLSYEDRIPLKDRLIRAFCSHSSVMEAFVKEERFSGGLVCPVCGCVHVIRNGHRSSDTEHGDPHGRYFKEASFAFCDIKNAPNRG